MKTEQNLKTAIEQKKKRDSRGYSQWPAEGRY